MTDPFGTAGCDQAPPRQAYDAAPLVVTWEVTQACALACAHCRARARSERDAGELTTREGMALLERLAAFGSPGPVLVFTGGDPLERPDLLELVAHAVALGLRTAVIPAPAPSLGPSVVTRLKTAGVGRLALSLDGSSGRRHDAFRGRAGSFAAVLRAATYATQVELPLQVNTTVTAATAPDLPEIAELVEALGAVTWEVFFLVPIGRGSMVQGLSDAETEDVLAWLYGRQRQVPFRVITVEAPQYRRVADQIERQATGRGARRVGSTGDGNGFLFISHTGDVCPSGFLPLPAGNVRRADPVDLYRNAPLFRQLRDRSLLKGKCGACEYRNLCGGSRAQAYWRTGDWLGSDPLCPYLPPASRRDEQPGGTGLRSPGRLRPKRGRSVEDAVRRELSQSEIDELLRSEVTGRIGCHADGSTYVVPMTYVFDGQAIYSRTIEGLKVRMMRRNPAVCFEVDRRQDLASWQSVILQGWYEELHGAQAEQALELLRQRLAPGPSTPDGRSATGRRTPQQIDRSGPQAVIYRINILEKTGRYARG